MVDSSAQVSQKNRQNIQKRTGESAELIFILKPKVAHFFTSLKINSTMTRIRKFSELKLFECLKGERFGI